MEFFVHFFNIGLGDSIVLETIKHGNSQYSIIDCHKVGNYNPVLNFLKEKKVRAISSIFISHFHRDHVSGFADLAAYCSSSGITVEYLITPATLTDKDWKQIVEGTVGQHADAFTKSIKAILGLPSLSRENSKTFLLHGTYQDRPAKECVYSGLHPGLKFVFLSPNPQQVEETIARLASKKTRENRLVNSLSQAMIIWPESCSEQLLFFPGDLESMPWINLKSRIQKSITHHIDKHFALFKVPHHGATNHKMNKILPQIIPADSALIAVISAPGNENHPSKLTLETLRKSFPAGKIVCTNKSVYCCDNISLEAENLWPDAAEEEFNEYVTEDEMTSSEFESTPCMGDLTIQLQPSVNLLSPDIAPPCWSN